MNFREILERRHLDKKLSVTVAFGGYLDPST